MIIAYVTLHFPPTPMQARLTIVISSMLAAAVLLSSINSQLTDVGYPTAIEYGFYAFFALCIYCLVASLITERLHSRKNQQGAAHFDTAARVTYALITVAVFVSYFVHYRQQG